MGKLIIITVFSLIILSCVSSHHDNNLYIASALKTDKKVNCLGNWLKCTKKCRDNIKQCQEEEYLIAANRYARYKNERILQGDFISKQLNSFKDPLQCGKVTCDCDADYYVCTKNSIKLKGKCA